MEKVQFIHYGCFLIFPFIILGCQDRNNDIDKQPQSLQAVEKDEIQRVFQEGYNIGLQDGKLAGGPFIAKIDDEFLGRLDPDKGRWKKYSKKKREELSKTWWQGYDAGFKKGHSGTFP